MPLSFQDLQNGFYNAITQGFGFTSQDNFQLVQPAIPLLAGPQADIGVWSYFNEVPPLALSHDFTPSGGDQFFSNYCGLFSALEDQAAGFQRQLGLLGPSWRARLRALPPTVEVGQLPQIFGGWAAAAGVQAAPAKAAALQSLLGDPITSAQLALMLYMGDPTANPPVPDRPADWSAGYAALLAQLRQQRPTTIAVSPNGWNADVSGAWAQPGAPIHLLRDRRLASPAIANAETTVASAGLRLSATFANSLRFSPQPGGWYNGQAFAIAFNQKGSPPWDASATTRWTDVFDPNHGTLARFVRSLLVVSQMNVVIASDAPLPSADRALFDNNPAQSIWPFYASNSGQSATRVAFDATGRLTITITSQPGVPIVLGCAIAPVAAYVA